MKVVHICTMDHGGAGIAARRLHEELLRQGVESTVLCRFRRSDDPTIQAAQPDRGLYRHSRNPLMRKAERILRRRGRCLTEVERYERQMELLDRQYGAAYTMPLSNYDLARHPLVRQADIVHLHWVENFIHYPTFFQQVGKPLVWTFHDENIAYGGFHYGAEAQHLRGPYADLEEAFLRAKREGLGAGADLHMVALCREMEQFYHIHSLAPQYPVEVIHNGLRPDDFQMLDRAFSRQVLGLPEDATVVCFCATDIGEPRKGLPVLCGALAERAPQSAALLCVGGGRLPEADFPVYGTGPIANPRLLSLAFSAANLFVFPSFQEAFGQTPVEAMACGCPVVAFPCGVTDELITERNGIRCADFTQASLATAIGEALSRTYDRQAIREDIVRRFDISRIARQYIDLYHRCL